jgi:hypothetical protein
MYSHPRPTLYHTVNINHNAWLDDQRGNLKNIYVGHWSTLAVQMTIHVQVAKGGIGKVFSIGHYNTLKLQITIHIEGKGGIEESIAVGHGSTLVVQMKIHIQILRCHQLIHVTFTSSEHWLRKALPIPILTQLHPEHSDCTGCDCIH